jgi:hypothetical protein
MASPTRLIRFWPFRKAPSRVKALFREGKDTDWVASVPESMTDVIEPHFFRLRQLHPVASVQLPDRSTVYWGAPRESISVIASQHPQPSVVAIADGERRTGVRVPLGYTMWYETDSRAPKDTGEGRVIDMSSTGIAFTTESLLRKNTRVELRIPWPVQLEGDVPVELYAAGKIVRAEPAKAALQYDKIAFRVFGLDS